jgi:class 3 adenylate cyclase
MIAKIEEFLTGAHHPPDPDRVLATVLFTDIVDSTMTASSVGDRRWLSLLDAHNAAARHDVEAHRGRLIKSTGDGILATFDGPGRAIRCAAAVRDAARSSELRSARAFISAKSSCSQTTSRASPYTSPPA